MIALLLSAALAAAPQNPQPAPAAADSFPHQRHERLFTNCVTCHRGIQSGDSATMFPSPSDCEQCHDGDLQRRVNWQPHAPRGTNLTYDHQAHAAGIAEGGEEALPCVRCHARSDSATFMEVGYAQPQRCLSCHGHQASNHTVNAPCDLCHVRVTRATRLSAERIANFPKPSTHDSTWVLQHGPVAGESSCRVCHSRDYCANCHVNAALVPAIQALGTDDRVASIYRGRRVSYPEPPSHSASGFILTHGPTARATNAAECANCHTRNSCLTCHRQEERVDVVAMLPARQRTGAQGVNLSGTRPPDHTPDFSRHHREAASGGDAACSRCHTTSFCASCHDAAASPGFHPRNFVTRHAQAAFAQDNECAACHQTQAFCRDCHTRTGRAPVGANRNYHDAQPNWIFGHRVAARRSLETCASCHQQSDCLRCHSATTGWKVSPHGSSFDPDTQNKNPAMCHVCHVTTPR